MQFLSNLPTIFIFHQTNSFQIDINSDLEPQGPFHVFIYKLTDKLANAENGDQNV